jgi:hypothetical protein
LHNASICQTTSCPMTSGESPRCGVVRHCRSVFLVCQ